MAAICCKLLCCLLRTTYVIEQYFEAIWFCAGVVCCSVLVRPMTSCGTQIVLDDGAGLMEYELPSHTYQGSSCAPSVEKKHSFSVIHDAPRAKSQSMFLTAPKHAALAQPVPFCPPPCLALCFEQTFAIC